MQLETKQNLPAVHKRKMMNKVLYIHSAMKAHKDNAKIPYFLLCVLQVYVMFFLELHSYLIIYPGYTWKICHTYDRQQ